MTQDNAGGRPTKLTEEFLTAAEKVLSQGDEVIICTDYELVILINEQLPEEQQIGKRTFETWKASLQEREEPEENLRRFQRLIEKALVREKATLFKHLREDKTAWQRWAWIIERKFDEWNIKRKIGVTADKDGAAELAAAMMGSEGEE